MLFVNNTNDAPSFISFDFPSKIVENHTVSFYVYASDEDYQVTNSYENLSFSSLNITGENLFNITTITNASNKTVGLISFTPQIGKAGDYQVNITVTDYYGLNTTVTKDYNITAKTNPPNITQIKPYGLAYSSTTHFNYTNTSNYNSSITYVSFYENRSVLYNVTVTDDTTSYNSLVFEWFVNGVSQGSSTSLNKSYGFFDSGSYNITVEINDSDYETSRWTWMATVQNLNRVPVLVNDLRNLTVNGTENYGGYMSQEGNSVKFLDPDNDLNSNNEIDGAEDSLLTYTVSSCSVASITFIDDSIKVTPSSIGTCTVYFNASDSDGGSTLSNPVTVNVTYVPPAESSSSATSNSDGGGGGGSSSSIIIPINKKDEKPKSMELIVPRAVTIYEGSNVSVPIIVKNNWNGDILDINLDTVFNTTMNLTYGFETDHIDILEQGTEINTTLHIGNYRFGENLEFTVTADATTPETNDSALVLINSLERSQDGKDVETKVTFAQDLLNENPECLELNELLEKAKGMIDEGQRSEASKIVDGVIEGCKYLVSLAKKEKQSPSSIIKKLFLEKENRIYLYWFIGIITVITGIIFGVRAYGNSKVKEVSDEGQEKVENKKDDEGFKPYWQR
jgi:hypothetical protein